MFRIRYKSSIFWQYLHFLVPPSDEKTSIRHDTSSLSAPDPYESELLDHPHFAIRFPPAPRRQSQESIVFPSATLSTQTSRHAAIASQLTQNALAATTLLSCTTKIFERYIHDGVDALIDITHTIRLPPQHAPNATHQGDDIETSPAGSPRCRHRGDAPHAEHPRSRRAGGPIRCN